MVFDFNTFRKQRGLNQRFGNQAFGVGNLTPTADQQMTGRALTPPGAATPRALPPIWRSDAGTASGELPPGWQYQPQLPGQGWDLNTPAPEAIKQASGAPLVANQTATPDTAPTPEQSRDAGLDAIYGPAAAADTSWSKETAGFTGSTYAYLLGKFDPWGNWGAYGPNQQGQAKWANGTRMETDKDVVYRWTNDILRKMGYTGGEDPRAAQIRTRIFLANVERLKSQYAASKMDWNTSDFANMDRQMATEGQAPKPPTSSAPGVNSPGGVPPATNPTPGTGGTNGNAGTDDALAFMMQDPQAAFRELMRRRGYQNLDSGGYAMQFLGDRYTPALQAAAQVASGAGGPNGIATETFADYLNRLQGGSLSRTARDIAHEAYGGAQSYLPDAGDDATQAYYENLNYLNSLGGGNFAQRAEQNRLKRYENQYGDVVMRTLAGDTSGPQTFEEFMRQHGYSIFR